MVFGRINEETPAYEVIRKAKDYELRRYEARVVAEYVTEPSKDGDSEGFRALARYIGVFGEPENRARQGNEGSKIAMTAPVLTQQAASESVAMTAPVLTSGGAGVTMAFVLPSKFTRDNAPAPTNPRVRLRERPSKVLACVTFSGSIRHAESRSVAETLLAALRRDGIVPLVPTGPPSEDAANGVEGVRPARPVQRASDAAEIDGVEWALARFNAPFTIPFLRTNEVYITVEDSEA
jgi:hypothetical protein